jgi:hypothetical protein
MPEDQPSHAVVNRVKHITPSAHVSGKLEACLNLWALHWNAFLTAFMSKVHPLPCLPMSPPTPSQDHSDNPFEQQHAEAA